MRCQRPPYHELLWASIGSDSQCPTENRLCLSKSSKWSSDRSGSNRRRSEGKPALFAACLLGNRGVSTPSRRPRRFGDNPKLRPEGCETWSLGGFFPTWFLWGGICAGFGTGELLLIDSCQFRGCLCSSLVLRSGSPVLPSGDPAHYGKSPLRTISGPP